MERLANFNTHNKRIYERIIYSLLDEQFQLYAEIPLCVEKPQQQQPHRPWTPLPEAVDTVQAFRSTTSLISSKFSETGRSLRNYPQVDDWCFIGSLINISFVDRPY